MHSLALALQVTEASVIRGLSILKQHVHLHCYPLLTPTMCLWICWKYFSVVSFSKRPGSTLHLNILIVFTYKMGKPLLAYWDCRGVSYLNNKNIFNLIPKLFSKINSQFTFHHLIESVSHPVRLGLYGCGLRLCRISPGERGRQWGGNLVCTKVKTWTRIAKCNAFFIFLFG